MVRLFVFDLDGTLVDSQRDIADSANRLLESCGADPLAEHAIAQMVGEGAALLVSRAFEAAGIAPPPNALEQFLAIYDTRLLEHTRPYAGMGEVLQRLGQRASLAVLTNKPLAATRRILAGLDLARHFPDEAVLGGDGPFRRKPDPAGLRYLATQAGVEADSTLLVGDSVVDWRTGQRASIRVCLARYGFGFQTVPIGELGADGQVIDAPTDLLAL
jgi:phosphoglycolate phosphatase